MLQKKKLKKTVYQEKLKGNQRHIPAMKYLLGDVYEISDEEDKDVETEVARYMAEPQKRDDPLMENEWPLFSSSTKASKEIFM